ncbi:MAG: hypothetical protein ACLFV6_03640 [Spirulinaceae cyanobacterium]|jgi:hypothetical protein
MDKHNINCAEACVNGCILGDDCPNKEFAEEASNFISDTPLDKMLEIAEVARMKKLSEPTKWVIPDDI